MVVNLVKVNIVIKMVLYMLDIFIMECVMGMENWRLVKVSGMLGIGSWDRCRGEDSIIIRMGMFILESFKMEKNMEMEGMCSAKVTNMMESGTREKCMEKGL